MKDEINIKIKLGGKLHWFCTAIIGKEDKSKDGDTYGKITYEHNDMEMTVRYSYKRIKIQWVLEATAVELGWETCIYFWAGPALNLAVSEE